MDAKGWSLMLKTTVGQLLVNEALPSEMRDYTRVMDKKGIKALLRQLVDKYPKQYREILKKLSDVGRDAAYTTGGQSFGLEHLRTTPPVIASRARLNRRLRDIMSKENWSDQKREDRIVEATAAEHERLTGEILDYAKKTNNPLAKQAVSGARGNPAQLKRLIGGDMLYMDHHDNVIPFPVQRSVSEGLRPAEFWASTYGARKGGIAAIFAVQDSGYLSKQLNQLAHRLMVVAEDDKADTHDAAAPRGYPVDVSDNDNAGALLAQDAGGYARNTTLTPKILRDLEDNGISRVLVRSPIVGGPGSGGVYARDIGVRERGGLSPLGDMVGLAAAQALSEKLTQGQLSAKHSGGVKGVTSELSGFQHINQLVQVPKTFKSGAAHAQIDGKVTRVEEAPAGGSYITISGERHFVKPGFELKVKRGDEVEAGDVLSDGIPNPSEIVKYKGIGEGRRYFIDMFADAYRANGSNANRRNIELAARGLIDHVEMLEEDGHNVPGDVMPYQQLESRYKSRIGTQQLHPERAVGKYLEKPVLHYTIGTQIKPSMLPLFTEFNVSQLSAHDEPPNFRPHMVRAMASVGHDPDWMTRFLGSNQKKSLLSAAQRGAVSDTKSTSFVPSLVQGADFGTTWPQSVLKPART